MSFFILITLEKDEMKKIFFAVFLSSFLMCSVNAFTSDLNITKTDYYVCDGNVKYPIYNIMQNDNHYYFLNRNENYNFDFRDYQITDLNNTEYNERVRAFTFYESMFMPNHNYEELYHPFVSLMIFRYLSNNDNLYLCDKDLNRISYYSKYEDDYQKIKDIIDGPNLINPIRILPNQDYLLTENNLPFYNYEGPEELHAFIPNSNTILFNAEKGTYEISFRYGINGTLGDLYTDSTNYLLKNGVPFEETFYYTVEVDDPTLYIYNHTDEDVNLSNICFNLTKENFLQTFCTNEDGVASIKVPIGIYNLEILSDINNDYSGNQIAINNIEEKLDINWGEHVTPNNDNNIGFIPSDTLEVSGITIVLLTMLGIGFGIKKTQ